MNKTIFIGDLHGCYEETLALLKKCDISSKDHVIFLGDYVDRGPHNDKCCDIVRQREQIQGKHAGILGNHEEKHLFYEKYLKHKGQLPQHMPTTHVATRQQLKREHYDWFQTLPLFIRVPEYNVAAVHAGAYPGRSLEEQENRHLLHIQMIRPYDEQGNATHDTKSIWPSRVPAGEQGWKFWSHFWNGPETLIFGHSVLDQPLLTDKVVGIDLGAVFGHQLCAYVLPDKKFVTVNGAYDYGKGRRERESINIQTFEIHNGVRTYS